MRCYECLYVGLLKTDALSINIDVYFNYEKDIELIGMSKDNILSCTYLKT